MNNTCRCCEGAQQVTPTSIVNRPGLNALAYRTGVYSTFLASMLARLASLGIPLGELGPLLQPGDDAHMLVYPLQALTTRASNDPSIALLDAWATVADVLTFYQERIVNESYLRAATERRSILELTKLVAYKLDPGVAASTYLSFILENGQQATIPAGTRAQSMPGQGQQPQSFETSSGLEARGDWNNLQPRMSIPQYITQLGPTNIDTNTTDGSVHLAGTSTNLKKNDPLLFVFGNEAGRQVFTHLKDVDPHAADKYTRITFQTEFTPLVFLRGALQLVETYLNLQAFGVLPTDPGVSQVTAQLGLVNALLLLGEGFLAQSSAGQLISPTLQDAFASLVLVDSLILWVENLAQAANNSPQFTDAIEQLHLIDGILKVYLSQLTDATLKPLLTNVQQQLEQFLAQLANSTANANANEPIAVLLNTFLTFLTGVLRTIEQYLLQAAVQFVNNTQFTNALAQTPDAATGLGQVLLSPFESLDVNRELISYLNGVGNNNIGVALAQLVLSPIGLRLYTQRLFFPTGVIKSALSAWCGVYSNAVKQNATQVAAWVGALITATKNALSDIASLSDQAQGICVPTVTINLSSLVSSAALAKPTLMQPAGSTSLRRDFNATFARKGDTAIQLLSALNPLVSSSTLYLAYGQAKVTPPPPLQNIYALRVKAAPFGNNAPKQASTTRTVVEGNDVFTISYTEWPLANTPATTTILDLDARYDRIVANSWVVIEYADGRNGGLPLICKVQQVQSLSRADYGLSAKVTRLTLDRPWLTVNDTTLAALRNVTVYTQSEVLTQADLTLTDDIAGNSVELDKLYNGLQAGRWVVVSGERSDIRNTSGVMDSELMMLASVTQDVHQANPTLQFAAAPATNQQAAVLLGGGTQLLPNNQPLSTMLPGDTVHTTLHFATPLSRTYKRSTVTIAGNVIAATQGETQTQILGSGNGSSSMQRFTLAKSPLTFVSVATPAGAESTLQISINGIAWHETDNLLAAGPNDRVFTTQIDDQGVTTVIFGGAGHGTPIPTGMENIQAVYRAGIGTSGNVDAGKISQLVTRPPGVRGVTNLLPATGGADGDSRDQARVNGPLASLSLGRLVSVQDYASFARTIGDIGKTSAARLSDGHQQVVYVTIAGLDTIPISTTSNLYRSLQQSLHQFGDPAMPVEVGVAEMLLLIMNIQVRVQTGHMFADVSDNVRAALLDAFSFVRRDLGQPLFQSEVLSVIQGVPGVAYVELQKLGAVDQAQVFTALDTIHKQELQAANNGTPPPTTTLADLLNLGTAKVIPVQLARPDPAHVGNILPAQLAFLSPAITDALIITQITATRFVPPVLEQKRSCISGGKQ